MPVKKQQNEEIGLPTYHVMRKPQQQAIDSNAINNPEGSEWVQPAQHDVLPDCLAENHQQDNYLGES
jgi:hypothetical protein